MSLLPHWGDCAEEINNLKIMLVAAQQQNIDYARDLVEISCKLRMAQLAPKKSRCAECTECQKNTTVDEEKIR